MTLCKQDGIFIERPDPVHPISECVYAMSVRVSALPPSIWDNRYAYSETVMYFIQVENVGTCDLNNIVLTDETGGAEWTIPFLATGEKYSVLGTYTVQPSDIMYGEVYLFVQADSDETHAQAHEVLETDYPFFSLPLDIYPDIHADDAQAGDVVTFTCRVVNYGNTTLTFLQLNMRDSETMVTDKKLTLAPEEEFTVQITRTLTAEDITNGFYVYASGHVMRICDVGGIEDVSTSYYYKSVN